MPPDGAVRWCCRLDQSGAAMVPPPGFCMAPCSVHRSMARDMCVFILCVVFYDVGTHQVLVVCAHYWLCVKAYAPSSLLDLRILSYMG